MTPVAKRPDSPAILQSNDPTTNFQTTTVVIARNFQPDPAVPTPVAQSHFLT